MPQLGQENNATRGDAAVIVLSTLETKQAETDYLVQCLARNGATARVLDISLASGGTVLDGLGKLDAMATRVQSAVETLAQDLSRARVVVGLGGGTGGEIIMRIFRSLPVTFPKVLITPLPFDPRAAVAESSVILVPTLVDICGMNATLRDVLQNAAAMTAGLCSRERAPTERASIGVTGLGATEQAVTGLVSRLSAQGHEATVFHSNGYGGAGFARFAAQGAFEAIVDLTPHEATRLHLAGIHVPMPTRFTAGSDLPRVLLPGAVNFVGLGEASTLSSEYLERPHYQHSGYFTHAKLTPYEMEKVAGELASALNSNSGPRALIVPMGGFSHQDAPGGAIEDPALRGVFLETARAYLKPEVQLRVIDAHISAPAITEAVTATLTELMKETTPHV